MPAEFNVDSTDDVTILSNMMAETKIDGNDFFACNWKEWMIERSECSSETILAYAESEAKSSGPNSKKWQNI